MHYPDSEKQVAMLLPESFGPEPTALLRGLTQLPKKLPFKPLNAPMDGRYGPGILPWGLRITLGT